MAQERWILIEEWTTVPEPTTYEPAKPGLADHWDQAVDWAWIGAAGLVFGITLRLRWPKIILADARLLSQRARDRFKG